MINSKTETTTAQLVTTITFLSFIVGVTNLTIYYFPFPFNVFEYIELSEIITHSIKYAFYIFFLSLIMGYLTLQYDSYRSKRTLRKPNLIEKTPNLDKLKTKLNYGVLSLMVLLIVYVIKYFSKGFSMWDSIYIVCLISLLLLAIFVTFCDYLKSEHEYEIPKKLMILGFASILTIMGSSIWSVCQLQQTFVNKNQGGSYIIVSRDTIKSNMNHFYIGRTKGYVFFYNYNTKTTDIYHDKDISKLQIR